jgi:hypothetical protein
MWKKIYTFLGTLASILTKGQHFNAPMTWCVKFNSIREQANVGWLVRKWLVLNKAPRVGYSYSTWRVSNLLTFTCIFILFCWDKLYLQRLTLTLWKVVIKWVFHNESLNIRGGYLLYKNITKEMGAWCYCQNKEIDNMQVSKKIRNLIIWYQFVWDKTNNFSKTMLCQLWAWCEHVWYMNGCTNHAEKEAIVARKKG